MPRVSDAKFQGQFPMPGVDTRVEGTRAGSLRVSDVTRVDGMIAGSVIVARNGTLDLRGIITGDLTVEHGGVAYLHGMVCGEVRTAGALSVHGVVCGTLLEQNDPPVHIAEQSLVAARSR
jgi:cytoskeletal protein CcmA (bactofilin family)